MRGATVLAVARLLCCPISIHAPLAGCDRCGSLAPACRPYFNPRTPCGVRPARGRAWPWAWHFNPRTPCGVRQQVAVPVLPVGQFQSTHPLRGATRVRVGHFLRRDDFNPRTPCGVRRGLALGTSYSSISIHAPLAGCDAPCQSSFCLLLLFQSTHPLRGATGYFFFIASMIPFQSTHPLRGATRCGRLRSWWWANFNPRTPCGVRLLSVNRSARRCAFQSTHPLRGATSRSSPTGCRCPFQSTHPLRGATLLQNIILKYNRFQSTHPLRGATRQGRARYPPRQDFNPRTPCGVRPMVVLLSMSAARISIHAPLAGCDAEQGKPLLLIAISIHAPLAGCDASTLLLVLMPARFQSTHPLRGATTSPSSGSS